MWLAQQIVEFVGLGVLGLIALGLIVVLWWIFWPLVVGLAVAIVVGVVTGDDHVALWVGIGTTVMLYAVRWHQFTREEREERKRNKRHQFAREEREERERNKRQQELEAKQPTFKELLEETGRTTQL